MAKSRMDATAFVGELLEQDDGRCPSRRGRVLSQALMEAKVSPQIGALPYERSTERAPNRALYELLEPARSPWAVQELTDEQRFRRVSGLPHQMS